MRAQPPKHTTNIGSVVQIARAYAQEREERTDEGRELRALRFSLCHCFFPFYGFSSLSHLRSPCKKPYFSIQGETKRRDMLCATRRSFNWVPLSTIQWEYYSTGLKDFYLWRRRGEKIKRGKFIRRLYKIDDEGGMLLQFLPFGFGEPSDVGVLLMHWGEVR